MAMFMVDDGLVVDAIVVMNQVLIILMEQLMMVIVMMLGLFMVMLRLFVVVCDISNGGVVNLVVFMEPMVHFLLFSVIEFL